MSTYSPHRPIFEDTRRRGSIRVGHQIGVPIDARIEAATVTITASVLTPTVAGSAAVAPSVVTLPISVLAPTVTSSGDATATAGLVELTVQIFTPTITADVADDSGDLFDDIGVAFDDPDFS